MNTFYYESIESKFKKKMFFGGVELAGGGGGLE